MYGRYILTRFPINSPIMTQLYQNRKADKEYNVGDILENNWLIVNTTDFTSRKYKTTINIGEYYRVVDIRLLYLFESDIKLNETKLFKEISSYYEIYDNKEILVYRYMVK